MFLDEIPAPFHTFENTVEQVGDQKNTEDLAFSIWLENILDSSPCQQQSLESMSTMFAPPKPGMDISSISEATETNSDANSRIYSPSIPISPHEPLADHGESNLKDIKISLHEEEVKRHVHEKALLLLEISSLKRQLAEERDARA